MSIDVVVRVCSSHRGDARSLRLALLDEIRRQVAFDAFAWLLTDPDTEVGSAPIAHVPCMRELPRLIRLKYVTPVNRWTLMSGPVAFLSTATGGRRDMSLVWRELLSGYGVDDVAARASLARRYGSRSSWPRICPDLRELTTLRRG